MLSKQSIRKGVSIYINGELIEKDEMIEISKEFTEREEMKFRKMLRQGGSFSIKDDSYEIKRKEQINRNNRGDIETPLKPLKPKDY